MTNLRDIKTWITNGLRSNSIFERCEITGDGVDIIVVKIYNHPLKNIDDRHLDKFCNDCVDQIDWAISQYSKEFKRVMICDSAQLSMYVYIGSEIEV